MRGVCNITTPRIGFVEASRRKEATMADFTDPAADF
jgi:hypothetical protein